VTAYALKGREATPVYLPSLQGRAGERFFISEGFLASVLYAVLYR
jgi:hypothetical protein